jgi:hypothetical protein
MKGDRSRINKIAVELQAITDKRNCRIVRTPRLTVLVDVDVRYLQSPVIRRLSLMAVAEVN